MTFLSSPRTTAVAGVAAVVSSAAVVLLPQPAPTIAARPTNTVGTWGTAVDTTTFTLADQTVRNIVHTSVGGSGLRISLSNAFGSVPVTFDSVWVGQAGQGAAVEAGTNRRLTFGDETSVTVPVGAEVLSDPLPGDLPAESTLAVSVHVVGDAGTVSGHKAAHQTNWVSTPGDHAADESAAAFPTSTGAYAWVESAVVETPQQVDTVVTLGDSITDGDRSTPGLNRRWPDFLARRVLARPTPHQYGVMNAGISGNRVLADGSGVSAQARFDRDVLAQPDVRTVVVMEGVNDLRWDFATKPADLINAYRQARGPRARPRRLHRRRHHHAVGGRQPVVRAARGHPGAGQPVDPHDRRVRRRRRLRRRDPRPAAPVPDAPGLRRWRPPPPGRRGLPRDGSGRRPRRPGVQPLIEDPSTRT